MDPLLNSERDSIARRASNIGAGRITLPGSLCTGCAYGIVQRVGQAGSQHEDSNVFCEKLKARVSSQVRACSMFWRRSSWHDMQEMIDHAILLDPRLGANGGYL